MTLPSITLFQLLLLLPPSFAFALPLPLSMLLSLSVCCLLRRYVRHEITAVKMKIAPVTVTYATVSGLFMLSPFDLIVGLDGWLEAHRDETGRKMNDAWI